MDNRATTPFGHCPSMASFPVRPHCTLPDETDAKKILTASALQRTGGDHQDALVPCGWRLSSRTLNLLTSSQTNQSTWLRISHSGDWCLRLALRTCSGVPCMPEMNEWTNMEYARKSGLVKQKERSDSVMMTMVALTLMYSVGNTRGSWIRSRWNVSTWYSASICHSERSDAEL